LIPSTAKKRKANQKTLRKTNYYFLKKRLDSILLDILFIHSSIAEHLGYFHLLAIVSNTAVSIVVQCLSSNVQFFGGYVHRSRIAGSYGNSVFTFFFFPFVVLGIEFRALHALGNYSITELHPQPCIYVFEKLPNYFSQWLDHFVF
jgi:hypothetical protein